MTPIDQRIADKRAEIIDQYRAINAANKAVGDAHSRMRMLERQMTALAEERAEIERRGCYYTPPEIAEMCTTGTSLLTADGPGC